VGALVKDADEEPAGGLQIPLLGDQDVDDLAVLVDRPVQILPSPSDLYIRLVHEPAISRDVPAGSCRID
jgi:hypothetical protein